jgi:hypothetical protein
MKRFFGKRRATRNSLGGSTNQPFGRLGALVFRLNNSNKLYWASLWAPARIAGCALSLWPDDHPLEERCLRKIPAPLARNPAQNNTGCADRRTISFSLWTVFAAQAKKTPGSRTSFCRERMHPQSTDELSAQVALLQSPILSAVAIPYRFDNPLAKQTKTMT